MVLLMLLVLLLGSAVSMSGLGVSKRSVSPARFMAGQQALLDARQALLSYTSSYPVLYGPRGAGPGHLPCPDTDSFALQGQPGGVSDDGPDPPCGSGRLARGHLPRHVSLPAARYLFHTEPAQRLAYAVSTAVINNPLNRPVNDQQLIELSSNLPVLAWIQEAGAARTPARTPVQTPVTAQSLRQASTPAVAAWLVERVNRRPAMTENIGAGGLWPLLVDQDTADGAAGTLNHTGWDNGMLEGTPARSHWFYRNGWHERISIPQLSTCQAPDPATCQLLYVNRRSDNRSDTGQPYQDGLLHVEWRSGS